MKKNKLILILLIFIGNINISTAQSIKILTNHLGYDVDASKKAIIEGSIKDVVGDFRIIDVATGKELMKGIPLKSGTVDNWKQWCFWTIDFSQLNTEGSYVIECMANGVKIASLPFKIRKHILEYETLSDVLYYFKGQRSSGLLDKADKTMKFDGKNGIVDVHGGWYDATGDYGKHLSHLSFSTYFNPQQISFTAWGLFKTSQFLERKNDGNFKQIQRRLLDEAFFGADYLFRVKNPDGSFYRSVDGRGPGKKPEDRIISKEEQGQILTKIDSLERLKNPVLNALFQNAPYETGYREGAGFAIAALALASTFEGNGDIGKPDYLKAAESAFEHLEKNNNYYLT